MIAYENDGPVATVDCAYPDEGDSEPMVTRDMWTATALHDKCRQRFATVPTDASGVFNFGGVVGSLVCRSLTPPEGRVILLTMSTVQEIEKAIEHLPTTDLFKLGEWFDERRERLWDDRIASDAKNGRLDFLIEEARAAKKAGTLRPFP